jgi:hypothetical protein
MYRQMLIEADGKIGALSSKSLAQAAAAVTP